MKNALFAVVCTLGAIACGGDNRPAESPTTPSTVTTTETTTTSAGDTARRNQAAAPTLGATTPQPATSPQPVTAARPSGGADAMGAPQGPGTGDPPTAQNPGVADNTKDATNTRTNDRDRHGALTPMDQGGGKDRDITAAIRRAVMADGSLSFNAKNVKIITINGKVTLRGPVKSDAERSTIEAKAKAAPGVGEVDNQLEVKK